MSGEPFDADAWAQQVVADYLARRDAARAENQRRRAAERAAERAARPWNRALARIAEWARRGGAA